MKASTASGNVKPRHEFWEREVDWGEIEFEDDEGDDVHDESDHADVDSDASYICDNCGEEIVIPIDMAAGQEQSYVEDCPVCCCPSLIHVYVDEDRVDVRAEPEQDRY